MKHHCRQLRAASGALPVDLTVAARFFLLLGSNFNGLWRVNGDGEYNVPIGRRSASAPPLVYSLATGRPGLLAQSVALARPGVSLVCADMLATVEGAGEGDGIVAAWDRVEFMILEAYFSDPPLAEDLGGSVDLLCFVDVRAYEKEGSKPRTFGIRLPAKVRVRYTEATIETDEDGDKVRVFASRAARRSSFTVSSIMCHFTFLMTDAVSVPSSNATVCSMVSPNPRASACTTRAEVPWRRPVSRDDISSRPRPERAASACCVRPQSWRSARTLAPRWLVCSVMV
jgi:hypothetical protein